METEASEVDWVEIAAFYVVGLVVIVLAPLIGFDNPFWLVGVTMGLGLIAYGLKLQQPTRRWVSTTVRLCCVAGIFIGVIGAWFGPLWYQLVLPVSPPSQAGLRINLRQILWQISFRVLPHLQQSQASKFLWLTTPIIFPS